MSKIPQPGAGKAKSGAPIYLTPEFKFSHRMQNWLFLEIADLVGRPWFGRGRKVWSNGTTRAMVSQDSFLGRTSGEAENWAVGLGRQVMIEDPYPFSLSHG